MRRASLLLAPLAAVALLAAPSPSFAQPEAQDKAAAEELYVAGTKLMNEGKFAEACPKLAESVRIDPGVGAMLYLGDCYERTQRPASAWGQFREAEDLAIKLQDQRAEVARKHADKLEPTLSKLVVAVPPASDIDGLEIRRDKVPIGRGQWQTAVPVDPGPHTISASASHKKTWETPITVPNGPGSVAVTVPVLEDAPVEPAAARPEIAADPATGKTQRIAGLAVGGAGVVTAVVGLIVGLGANSTYSASNANNHCTNNLCDGPGLQDRSDAFSAARTATILTLTGVLVAGTGVVLFLTAPKKPGPAIVVAPSVGQNAGRLDLHVFW